MTYVVVVADDIDQDGLDELQSSDAFEVVSTVKTPERLPEELRRADALLVRSATQVTESLMSGAPSLRVIGRAGIGVDNIDLDAATHRGIAVLNAPGANTVSAAEHTIALLLSLVRNIPSAAKSMQDGVWDRKRFGGTELRGKVLGLIGLGRIGMHVSGIAQAFGMEVVGFDPYLSPVRATELRIQLLTLDQVLERADVISLHAPLTPDTDKILNAQTLAKLRPTAVVVNTARGGLIDDAALVDAVTSGRLAGAALDVFAEEPLPKDSVLRGHERIVLTPHLAASTNEAQERVATEICCSVRHALETGDVGRAVNVPGVSGEVLARSIHILDLARRVGLFAGQIAKGAVSSIEVFFGGKDEEAAKPVMLCAVEGVLRSMGVGPVSLVNARVLADERNIALSRRIGSPVGGFDTTVGITIKMDDKTVKVIGANDAVRGPRVIRIDGFEIDVPAHGPLLIIRNSDVPGVIGRVGTVLGEASVNIAYYSQSRGTNGSSGALAAISVDESPTGEVIAKLEQLSDVMEVRAAQLG